MLITDVETGGPADSAGLLPGDVLVSVGERPVSTAMDLDSSLQAGSDARLRIRREKRALDVDVTPQAFCTSKTPITRRVGPRAGALFSQRSLARAGVAPEAIVLSIDGAAPADIRRPGRAPRLVRYQLEDQAPAFAFVRP
jgi:hypothetical protein